MIRLPKALALLVALTSFAPDGRAAAQTPPASPSSTPQNSSSLSDTARVRRWREDVRFIVRRVKTTHPQPFLRCSEASFDSAARAIEALAPTSDDARMAAECMKLGALLNDGHSRVIGTLPALGFDKVLPIALRPFEDGIYVVAADAANADAVGKRVTRIGDLPADAALDRVMSVTAGENRYTRLDRVPIFFMVPTLLRALGVSRSRDQLVLEVENPRGRRKVLNVVAGAPPDGFPGRFLETEPDYPADWKSARNVPKGGLPRCDLRPDEAWWYEDLPGDALYLRLRRIEVVNVQNGDPDEYRHFFKRFFAHADSTRPSVLVIDLRHDHGGNNGVDDPLIKGLTARPWLNREGSLFAIIDRGTFSAAMNAVQFMEAWTHATFVGEPTGGAPNHFGDARHAESPNFKLDVTVSTLPWMSRWPMDTRLWTAPEIALPSTFAKWRDAVDLELMAALEAAKDGTRDQQIVLAYRSGGTDAAAAKYLEWTKEHPNPWSRSALGPLTSAIDSRMEEGRWAEAVALGEALVKLEPKSEHSWRYAGEAQLNAGNRDKAVQYLREALKINPQYNPAQQLLRALGAGS